MFNIIKKIFSMRKEIGKLNREIEILRLDLRTSLSVSEKYLPRMRASDRLKLLVLRQKV